MSVSEILSILRGVSVLLTLGIIAAIAYLLATTPQLMNQARRMGKAVLHAEEEKKRTVRAWKKIQAHLAEGDEKSFKIAIIEADILLGDVLRLIGLPGENVGERLKQVKSGTITDIDGVWSAHKMRNRISHEADISVSFEDAKKILAQYERVFKEFGLLD